MAIQIPSAVADLLRAAAPTLAAALAGPFAPLAAALASAAIKEWLPPHDGVSQAVDGKSASPEAVVDTVQANASDPKFILDLKKAEIDLKRYEHESGFKFAELAQKDRADARAMARDTGIADKQFIAGMAIVVLALLLLFAVVAGCVAALTGTLRLDQSSAQIAVAAFGLIGTVVGVFQAVAAQILAYYFGSSAGSAQKTDQITNTMRDLGGALADAAKNPVPQTLPPQPHQPSVVVVPTQTTPSTSATPAKPSRFIALVERLLDHEGGYVDNPSDPGGCTNMGITLATLRDWREGADTTCDDVRSLTRQEAKEIYFARYWNALCCDSLPPGVDEIVFDFGVNAGVSRSAKTLQTILAKRDPSLKVDGVVGPLTLSAMDKASPRAVIEEFQAARMAHYRGLKTWATFGNGWTKRANDVFASAMSAASMPAAA